jgi:hypothetical protein
VVVMFKKYWFVQAWAPVSRSDRRAKAHDRAILAIGAGSSR